MSESRPDDSPSRGPAEPDTREPDAAAALSLPGQLDVQSKDASGVSNPRAPPPRQRRAGLQSVALDGLPGRCEAAHARTFSAHASPAISRHSLYTARTCTRALPAAFKVSRPAVGGVGENRGRENSLGTGGTGATPRATERQTTVGPLTSGQLTSGKLKTDDILGKPREARASKGDGVPIKVGETICLYSADRQAYLSMNDLEGPRPPWMDAFG